MGIIVCICCILLGCLLELLIFSLVIKYERYIEDLEYKNNWQAEKIKELHQRIEMMKQ